METKQQKINRLAKKLYKYAIFCGDYFWNGYNEKDDAKKELETLKTKYPNDNWTCHVRDYHDHKNNML